MPMSALRAVVLAFVAAGSAVLPLAAQGDDPVADPRAVVRVGDARFTVLTPQLLRMEWAPGARFEDRASLVFLNRRLPVPRFTSRQEGEWHVIETDALTLRYRGAGGRFTAEDLEVRLKAPPRTTWRPGMADTANLQGTTRTLDGARGPVKLEPGLVSRDGWVVVDDSERPLFDASPWPWVLPRVAGATAAAPAATNAAGTEPAAPSGTAAQDLYFFGYGHDYRRALADFTRVAGKIPMPPRFAFGSWWSRYWAYTDEEFKQLVRDFNRNDVPLDVLVVDMDWHNTFELRWEGQPTDQAEQRLGWTGRHSRHSEGRERSTHQRRGGPNSIARRQAAFGHGEDRHTGPLYCTRPATGKLPRVIDRERRSESLDPEYENKGRSDNPIEFRSETSGSGTSNH